LDGIFWPLAVKHCFSWQTPFAQGPFSALGIIIFKGFGLGDNKYWSQGFPIFSL
jgi:hypothetical protein